MHVPTPVYQKLPFGFAGRAASYGGQAVPVSKGATQPSAEAHRNCVDAGSDVAGVRDDLTYFDEMLTVLDVDNYNTLQQTSYFWKWLWLSKLSSEESAINGGADSIVRTITAAANMNAIRLAYTTLRDRRVDVKAVS